MSFRFPRVFLVPFVCLSALVAQAKNEDWSDGQGGKFRGEASSVLGPFAFIRTSETTARRLPLHVLSPEECVRLFETLATQKPRSTDWGQGATGALTAELRGHVQRVESGKLVPEDLKGKPEPEFLIVFFASTGEGPSWTMLGDAMESYWKFKNSHPGLVEGLFVGLRHSRSENQNMATSMNLPWLVLDPDSYSGLSVLKNYLPGSGFGILVLTRQGMPVFAESDPEKPATLKVLSDLQALLDLALPDNPKNWKSRAHYLRATQCLANPQGCGVLMVGNPLRAEGLRQRKVYRFDAEIKVLADSSVADVVVKPGDMPEAMVAPLADALRKATYVAAVSKGAFVDSTYQYHFEISR